MATGVMSEYFTRLGVTVLPGVLGYAFESGEIEQDREALAQVERLAADCRNHLNLVAGKQDVESQRQIVVAAQRRALPKVGNSVQKR